MKRALLAAGLLIFLGGCTSPTDSPAPSGPQQLWFKAIYYHYAGKRPTPSFSGTVGVPFESIEMFAVTNTEHWECGNVTLASGSLPPGLYLNDSGEIKGTPTRAGSYAFTVLAPNVLGDNKSFGDKISYPATIVITGGPPP